MIEKSPQIISKLTSYSWLPWKVRPDLFSKIKLDISLSTVTEHLPFEKIRRLTPRRNRRENILKCVHEHNPRSSWCILLTKVCPLRVSKLWIQWWTIVRRCTQRCNVLFRCCTTLGGQAGQNHGFLFGITGVQRLLRLLFTNKWRRIEPPTKHTLRRKLLFF